MDVGGIVGGKIIFNTKIFEIAVLKIDRLSRVDWYPYEGKR